MFGSKYETSKVAKRLAAVSASREVKKKVLPPPVKETWEEYQKKQAEKIELDIVKQQRELDLQKLRANFPTLSFISDDQFFEIVYYVCNKIGIFSLPNLLVFVQFLDIITKLKANSVTTTVVNSTTVKFTDINDNPEFIELEITNSNKADILSIKRY